MEKIICTFARALLVSCAVFAEGFALQYFSFTIVFVDVSDISYCCVFIKHQSGAQTLHNISARANACAGKEEKGLI